MMSYPLRFATALAAAIVVSLSSSGVYAVDLFAPNWVIPDNEMPYPSLTASVGDTLTFAWSGGVHDVHIHPSHTCGDPEGSIQIASTDDNPTTYTFLEEDGSLDGTVHTFVCQVGSHCDRGMYMNVTGTCCVFVTKKQKEEHFWHGTSRRQGIWFVLVRVHIPTTYSFTFDCI